MMTTSALCPANNPIATIIATVPLDLPERGWRLHPLKPGAKQPLLLDWPARASADIETVLTWAAQHPGCNWGLATGLQSSIWVLDVDGETGAASLRALCDEYGEEWTRTLTCITARGRHFYFNADTVIKCSVEKIAAGLDVRGDGGYVLVPPSAHPDGPLYEWAQSEAEVLSAPAWLLDLVNSSPAPSSRRRRTVKQESRR